MQFISQNEGETQAIAKKIAPDLVGGDIVLLSGELGAGKTTFVKGLARALGLQEEMTSPTFTLMNVYDFTESSDTVKNFVHIDTYRLKDEKDLVEIGAEDYIGKSETITVIEWPEKIPTLFAGKSCIAISLTHLSPQSRAITISDRSTMPNTK